MTHSLVTHWGCRKFAWLVPLGLAFALSRCVESAPIFEEESPGSASGGRLDASGGRDGMGAMAGALLATGGTGETASGGEMGLGGQNLGGATSRGPTGDDLLVAGGDTHTCGIVDGDLYCWGGNSRGALGLGDEGARLIPTLVDDTARWSAIGCGNEFSCGIADGTLSCWGAGSNGQLGSGSFSSTNEPYPVSLSAPIRRLAVGHEHVCAVLSDGTLWCWGNNTEGQLGQDDPFPGPGVDAAFPVQVGTDSDWETVDAGQGHSCALKTDGRLYCWGRNSAGELGLGDDVAGQIRSAQRVGSATDFRDIALGQNHTCALKTNGTVACWGGNYHGQLGLPRQESYTVPTELIDFSDIAQIATDTFHTCLLDMAGRLTCLGRNEEGQLGDGTTTDAPWGTAPLLSESWEFVDTGRFHTCGVRQGAFYCTGENSEGRLGTDDRTRRSTFSPTRAD